MISKISEILALLSVGSEVTIPLLKEDVSPFPRYGQVPGDLSLARLVVRVAVGFRLLRVFRRLRQRVYEAKSGDHRYAG